MQFSDKIKELRDNINISQEKLASELGITKRTIVNYENGSTLPPVNILPKIAKYFGVPIGSLLTEEEELISHAYEKGGRKSARDAHELIDDATGLFAGGRISEDEKDAVIKALLDAYWIAKEKNKDRYTPKKYRSKEQAD